MLAISHPSLPLIEALHTGRPGAVALLTVFRLDTKFIGSLSRKAI
jgi:hypothetical protein